MRKERKVKRITWKNVVKAILTAILSLIIVINLMTVLFSFFGLRDTINWIPGAFVTVESGSMSPVVEKGDLIFVWRTSPDSLKVGDIITYYSGNDYITHGIIALDEDSIKTKGLNNEMADGEITETEYCAKMIFKISDGARVLDILSSGWILALCVISIAVLFYGVPFMKWLFGMFSGEPETGKNRIGIVRVAASFAMATTLIITPCMTAGKYTAEINDIATASASAVYFSSNYLSSQGNIYNARWNGSSYTNTIMIKNYSNELLYNRVGVDVKYKLTVEYYDDMDGIVPHFVKGEDGEEDITYYTVTLNPPTGLTKDANGYYTIFGDNDKKTAQSFELSLNAMGQLVTGTKIRFRVIAETSETEYYYNRMVGDFTFEATEESSFIGSSSLKQTTTSSLVEYKFKTNEVDGVATRTVLIKWDATKLYVNELEETTLRNITYGNWILVRDEDGQGSLRMTIPGRSNIKLEFFKTAENVDKTLKENRQTAMIGGVVQYEQISIIEDVPEPPPGE